MPRRKPISGKQKKEQQQIKRAIKRGDLPPSDHTKQPSRNRRPVRAGPTGKTFGLGSSSVVATSARKLQSVFIKLPPTFLEDTRAIASTVPLSRPISYKVAHSHDFANDGQTMNLGTLSCPRRPKWRFDMSKREVEHNEEGAFKKWLVQTDGLVEQWHKGRKLEPFGSGELYDRPLVAPPSPTYFERNLEVWRQLWRVTEISQIILVLLDSRFPLLHFPPSLADYLVNRKVILVLTKVDITGPVRVGEWMKYLKTIYPNLRIIQVESYTQKETMSGNQGKNQFEPHLSDTLRRQLVEAIRETHAEMLAPPQKVTKNLESPRNWASPAKREIDWDEVLRMGGDQVGGTTLLKSTPDGREAEGPDFDKESEILTVGLIGQPNVGKSSLLNALFGSRRVKTSKTPGKTKHFQTLYWTKDIRLVDCPGLVMPNYVPMEMQVLTGIVPISKVSAIPACIYYVAQIFPLEKTYRLNHPATTESATEDKRTRREGMPLPKPKLFQWTAIDILTARANSKGWVTAKAGRPDVHRAGNAILRALAEGRLSWAFWPPGTSSDLVAKESPEKNAGIWISGRDNEDDENEDDSDEEGAGEIQDDESSELPSELPSEIGESGEDFPTANTGRFNALQIIDSGSEGEKEA